MIRFPVWGWSSSWDTAIFQKSQQLCIGTNNPWQNQWPHLNASSAHGQSPWRTTTRLTHWATAVACSPMGFPKGHPKGLSLASPSLSVTFSLMVSYKVHIWCWILCHNAMSPQNLCNSCQLSWTHNFGAAGDKVSSKAASQIPQVPDTYRYLQVSTL